MILAIPKETESHEKRVALTPSLIGPLIKEGLEVRVESGAGMGSWNTDQAYEEAGAKIAKDAKELYEADIILRVQPPSIDEVKQMKEDSLLISFLGALQNKELVDALKEQKVTALGLEQVPRISRAQKMDALSSMSSIAGYKATLMAANHLGKYMPMMMTAAGTIAPAKVLVLGAGVAGLQSIATARRLGSVVEAFDIRPAVKEQVESLGAKFVEVPLEEDAETEGGYAKELSEDKQERQRQVIHEHVKKSDVVITTALVPGKKAPVLVTKAMVDDMKAGSVVVDLAAEQGGNCEVTEADKTQNVNNVQVIGPVNVPSMLPYHASELYGKNIKAVLDHLLDEGKPVYDFEDQITKDSTVTHQGELVSPSVKEHYEGASA